jgi:hypothetical protein
VEGFHGQGLPGRRRTFMPLFIKMFRTKVGGIRVVPKKRSAIGTFF